MSGGDVSVHLCTCGKQALPPLYVPAEQGVHSVLDTPLPLTTIVCWRCIHRWQNSGIPGAICPFCHRKSLANSGKNVWWCCDRSSEHVWKATVDRVTKAHKKGNRGCPFCSGRRVTTENCLAATYPQAAAYWHKSLNKGLSPWQVTSGSGRTVWWQCQKNPDHIWQRRVVDVYNQAKKGISFCAFCRAASQSSGKEIRQIGNS